MKTRSKTFISGEELPWEPCGRVSGAVSWGTIPI